MNQQIKLTIDWTELELVWAQRYEEDFQAFISQYPAGAGS